MKIVEEMFEGHHCLPSKRKLEHSPGTLSVEKGGTHTGRVGHDQGHCLENQTDVGELGQGRKACSGSISSLADFCLSKQQMIRGFNVAFFSF